jgi:hypothetical protein
MAQGAGGFFANARAQGSSIRNYGGMLPCVASIDNRSAQLARVGVSEHSCQSSLGRREHLEPGESLRCLRRSWNEFTPDAVARKTKEVLAG